MLRPRFWVKLTLCCDDVSHPKRDALSPPSQLLLPALLLSAFRSPHLSTHLPHALLLLLLVYPSSRRRLLFHEQGLHGDEVLEHTGNAGIVLAEQIRYAGLLATNPKVREEM
jgi:hypothetical protein